MRYIFIKKNWDEENVLFYLHFQDGRAVRQIEITPSAKLFLSLDHPQQGKSILYDQSLDELDLEDSDFITQLEFDNIWKNNNKNWL